ncbi:MAG: ABC transporter ATP-binding protein [Christensenellaceae bacterium]|nr:ABC transporter ATP-binding protein [Christensenellaceae bacterium]
MEREERSRRNYTTKQILLRLLKYMAKHKLLLALSLILTVASNLFNLIGPTLSGYAVNAIEPGVGKVDFEKVIYYCVLMIILYAVSSIMQYILGRVMQRMSMRVSYQLRKDVFEKLVDLPVGFFDKTQTGDIISVINYDVDTISASLSTDLLQVSTSIITVLGSLFAMIAISPPLVLVFCFTIPVSILFTIYKSKTMRPLFRKRSKKLGEMNGFVEEVTSGQKTTKAYHQEQTMIDRFDVKNHEAVEAFFDTEYYGAMMGPTVNFINNISLSLVSVFGALMYLGSRLSLGDLSSFVLYSRKFSGPINEAANIFSELQSCFSASNRVFTLIDSAPEPEDRENAIELADVRGNVKIDHVRFGYDSDVTIIKDFSLDVKEGSLIAIVGPTGAGKTTIVNLLMRFYDVNDGAIYTDGHDIRDIKRKSLRLSYSMVLQDTWLFYGTIYENIAYGKEGVTKEEVIEAAKAAKIHDFIMSLPKGYDTLLSDNAVNISKGQKQLLTIARAMLLDSKMLILDEATSNVDTQTERLIQDAMYKLMEGKTCFVIAHRLSTIRNADTILVMNGGEVIEQGSHDELMEKNGFYANMYYSQFAAY